MPVPMSCSDIGWITGESAPPCATMSPLRAWSSGSNPGVSASGPGAPAVDVAVHEPGVAGAEAADDRGPSSSTTWRLMFSTSASARWTSAVNASRPAASLRSMQTWSLSRFSARVRRRRHGAEVLAPGRVDLHDARAEVLEHEAPERTGEELRGVDDEHAVERQRGRHAARRHAPGRPRCHRIGPVQRSRRGREHRGEPRSGRGRRHPAPAAGGRWRRPSRWRPTPRASAPARTARRARRTAAAHSSGVELRHALGEPRVRRSPGPPAARSGRTHPRPRAAA